MRVFGLIGFPLSHSISADYFNSKFRALGLMDCIYKLFPIENIVELRNLLHSETALAGLNVTIPYKEKVIPFINELSSEAQEIGAVNCINIRGGKLTGFNTDCFGFGKAYLKAIIETSSPVLILGNGGASKAVQFVLKKYGIDFLVVSRTKLYQTITYQDVTNEIIKNYKVIINTTSLGMFPDIKKLPPINFMCISAQHILIDMIYNPESTEFLKQGLLKGCMVFNGLSMFQLQAEKAWEIWNSTN